MKKKHTYLIIGTIIVVIAFMVEIINYFYFNNARELLLSFNEEQWDVTLHLIAKIGILIYLFPLLFIYETTVEKLDLNQHSDSKESKLSDISEETLLKIRETN